MRTKNILASCALLGSSLAAVCVAGAGPAAGVTPTTVNFSFTGAAQAWVVPAGVTSARFDVYGAAGGDNSIDGCSDLGGLGGHVTATLAVTPGQSINIVVGGHGGNPITESGLGGFNGGDSG